MTESPNPIRFGGKPTHAPPDPKQPYLWVGDRWLLVSTDTSDGVPESLDFPPPEEEEARVLHEQDRPSP
jgi:hypothetical protein